jgi:hypothetical protein
MNPGGRLPELPVNESAHYQNGSMDETDFGIRRHPRRSRRWRRLNIGITDLLWKSIDIKKENAN